MGSSTCQLQDHRTLQQPRIATSCTRTHAYNVFSILKQRWVRCWLSFRFLQYVAEHCQPGQAWPCSTNLSPV